MAPRLKVFRTHLGFYDAIVAASSRKAALAAWGTKQDMFREGFASETDDPDIRKAALAKPGIVLRRAAGSKDPFSENPALPKMPAGAKPKKAPRAAAKAAPVAPLVTMKRPALPPPDRTKFDAAMKALALIDREEKQALAGIEHRREALDADEKRIEREFEQRRKKAKESVEREKRALSRA